MTRSSARSSGSGDTAKKTPAKKAPTKKVPAQKAPAKATAASKPPESEQQRQQGAGGTRASRIAGLAAAQLLDLTGKQAEGVVGLEKTEDGWTVQVEVLELRRIPSTTDVLATYEVAVDREGELTSYRRVGRFVRGSADREGR